MQQIEIARLSAALIGGYLIGGIPFGLIVTRLVGGPDPRTIGSGRLGGANVSRAVGFKWAMVSGLLDFFKATVAVLLMRLIGAGVEYQVLAAIAVVIGHSRSPYIGFKGGRGVAPAGGGALILAPLILLVILPVFILLIVLTRITSIGSLSASLAGGVAMIAATALMHLNPIFYLYGVAIPGLIWLFHTDNIGRLLRGEERRITFLDRKGTSSKGESA